MEKLSTTATTTSVARSLTYSPTKDALISVAVMTKGYPSIQRKDLVLLQEIASDMLLACGAVYLISPPISLGRSGSSPSPRSPSLASPSPTSPTHSCYPDAEGSWSACVFLGDSPFSLKPIEDWGISSDEGAAWPIANPAVTCADVSEAGFDSSFIANPFLFIQVKVLQYTNKCLQEYNANLQQYNLNLQIDSTKNTDTIAKLQKGEEYHCGSVIFF